MTSVDEAEAGEHALLQARRAGARRASRRSSVPARTVRDVDEGAGHGARRRMHGRRECRAHGPRRRPARLARLDGRAARRRTPSCAARCAAPGRASRSPRPAPQPRRPHARAAPTSRWARARPRAPPRAALDEHDPRAIVYSTTTAALLWPRAGRDPLRRARRGQPARAATGSGSARSSGGACAQAPLLLPWAARLARRDARRRTRAAVVVPIAVEPSGPARRCRRERDIAALTYAANPHKKGLDRVLDAWVARAPRRARSSSSRATRARPGRRPACARRDGCAPDDYRALAAARARLRHRAAPRGLRDRPARGARRRLRCS